MDIPQDMKQFNENLIVEYRANGGKLSGRLAQSRLLLLTTTGAKSGQSRTTPMGYAADGVRLVVIASNNSAAMSPDWYHNLLAHPEATVELGADRFPVRATFPQGPEREWLVAWSAEHLPYFAGQQERTTREIPFVVFERVDA